MILFSDFTNPEYSWSDDEIIEWARAHKYARRPRESFALSCVPHWELPDTIEINWTTKPPTCRRFKATMGTMVVDLHQAFSRLREKVVPARPGSDEGGKKEVQP